MRWVLVFLGVLFAFAPVQDGWAAQDDGDADLRETPEELARAAVLRRWPDAQNIDAFDDAAAEEEEVADAPADEAQEAEVLLPEQMLPEKGGSDWTVSVAFTCHGREFEVLVNDDGVIRYVYEEVPIDDAPVEVLKGARAEIARGDFLYVDKVMNEHRRPAVATYVVGFEQKDVYVDDKGKVLKVVDLPKEELAPADPAEMDGAL
ncbi:MAG TPA: hypothetical protein VEJ63_21890 [Planctomycetota bacterium]|nr:hypothetical protein [Planctomycetota bacterium]